MPESKNIDVLNRPWSAEADAVLSALGTDAGAGLSGGEIAKRRRKYGRNELREPRKKSAFQCLIDQFKSLVILLLAAAAVVSVAVGQSVEGVAIALAIVINTAIGFVIELKAVRSMEALRKMSKVTARVRRDGEEKEIPSAELVVGDAVVLEGGDIVSADMRLIEANKLDADESALTGESVPVSKKTEAVESNTQPAERVNMAFKGTHVTRGSGVGVVTAVGRDSELGKISEMVEEAEQEATPLEKKLDRLANNLIWITLAITAVIAGTGIIRGKDVALMIETGVALAVAAIPEGLPIVATVSLAHGMMQMARKNALVNRLASVETLGSTGVIGADKTGTLTENRMTVSRLCLPGRDVEIEFENGGSATRFLSDGEEVDPAQNPSLNRALSVGVLCNNASLGKREDEGDASLGDPLEVALLAAGAAAGIFRDELMNEAPEEREVAFDSETSMMATYHREDGAFRVAVKGAPEAVIDSSSEISDDGGSERFSDERKGEWKRRNDELAERGLRVLALAERKSTTVTLRLTKVSFSSGWRE
jgi:Ca2+-transporting ATPase